MRRQSKRPRFNISSLYTGAGSKQEVFNRTSTKPFAKLKRNYGNFLERFRSRSLNTYFWSWVENPSAMLLEQNN